MFGEWEKKYYDNDARMKRRRGISIQRRKTKASIVGCRRRRNWNVGVNSRRSWPKKKNNRDGQML